MQAWFWNIWWLVLWFGAIPVNMVKVLYGLLAISNYYCMLPKNMTNMDVSKPRKRGKDHPLIPYQLVMNRTIAQVREALGLRPLPQHKQRLTAIIRSWLARRNSKAPTPSPVAISESYWQYFLVSVPWTIVACQREDCESGKQGNTSILKVNKQGQSTEHENTTMYAQQTLLKTPHVCYVQNNLYLEHTIGVPLCLLCPALYPLSLKLFLSFGCILLGCRYVAQTHEIMPQAY